MRSTQAQEPQGYFQVFSNWEQMRINGKARIAHRKSEYLITNKYNVGSCAACFRPLGKPLTSPSYKFCKKFCLTMFSLAAPCKLKGIGVKVQQIEI